LISSIIRKSCYVSLPINYASIDALIQSSSLDPAKSSVIFFLFFFYRHLPTPPLFVATRHAIQFLDSAVKARLGLSDSPP
jgi:hypothetical protein